MSIFYLNKLLAIAFAGILHFSIAILGSYIIDEYQPRTEDKSKIKITLEIILNVGLLVIWAYYVRKIVELIPYPLDGVGGFEYDKLETYSGTVIVAWSIFSRQIKLSKRIKINLDLLSKKNIFGINS